MAKPATDPRWIASGEIATPSTPKQDGGWLPGEKPPSQFLNWFMNLVYQWCLYLKNFGDHAQVFTETVELQYPKVIETSIQIGVCLDSVKPVNISGTGATTGPNGVEFFGTGSDITVNIPLPSHVGYKLTGIKFWGFGLSGVNSTDWEFIVKKMGPGTSADIATDTTAPIPTGAFNDTFAVSTTKLVAGESLYLTLTSNKNSTNHAGSLYAVSATYTKESYTP